MPLEEYVYHVTLAEVPASFSPQALRACAVAVRSYALYKLLHSSDAAHAGAQLCTESRHCMAFPHLQSKERKLPFWMLARQRAEKLYYIKGSCAKLFSSQ